MTLKCIQHTMKEIFTRTLKSKIYKHMTALSKNVCMMILDDILNKYNNTFHKTI